MLRSIEIKNYALIDNLKIDFNKGLNIITGETGAGKSILLGALGLIMGKRADSKVLFDNDSKCVVEARYDIKNLNLKWFFVDEDLDYEDELIIRREISTSGKSRAFINDTPSTLDVLQSLSDLLVDLHQQFDTQDIQKTNNQLDIIDLMSDNLLIRNLYAEQYNHHLKVKKELAILIEESQKASQELDYHTFQLSELDEANFTVDDQQEIEDQLKILESSEEIQKAFAITGQVLEENEQSVISTINGLLSEIKSVAGLNENYQSLYERLISTSEELKDIAAESVNISESTDLDQEEVQRIQERLSSAYRLQKKHGVTTITALIQIHEELSLKVAKYQDIDSEINKKTSELEKLNFELLKTGKNLTDSRTKVAPIFKEQTETLLSQLAMENAKIEVRITQNDTPLRNGLDNVSLYFSANKGSELQPLKDVASGGETSRLALCIKSILANKSALPTMVFDEIDSGVSGEIAQKMGVILTDLSNEHQIITITHSPQIASRAHKHFFVYKYDTDLRTITKIKELDRIGRIDEIAKMMSGDPPSKPALEAAEVMVGKAV